MNVSNFPEGAPRGLSNAWPNSGTAPMTARSADANRRSWASTPEADDMGIRRSTGHFSSVITRHPSPQALANSNTATTSTQADTPRAPVHPRAPQRAGAHRRASHRGPESPGDRPHRPHRPHWQGGGHAPEGGRGRHGADGRAHAAPPPPLSLDRRGADAGQISPGQAEPNPNSASEQGFFSWGGLDSNQRPTDYESAALTD